MLSERKLAREIFISKLAESSNEVFKRNGLRINVVKEDINNTLECFESWRDEGVFNIFKPVAERNVEDIYKLLDYMESNNLYSKNDIDQIRYSIGVIENGVFNHTSYSEIESLINNSMNNCESEKVKNSLSIMKSSYKFWPGIRDKSNMIPNVDYSSGTTNSSNLLKWEPDWWSINVILADAVGALLCWYAGPLSIICAAVASAIYIAATTNNDKKDDKD